MLGSDCKLDPEPPKSNPVGETATGKKEGKGPNPLGQETMEESYKDWTKYWDTVRLNKIAGILDVAHG